MIRRIALTAAIALAAAPALAGGITIDLPHLTWPTAPAPVATTTSTSGSTAVGR